MVEVFDREAVRGNQIIEHASSIQHAVERTFPLSSSVSFRIFRHVRCIIFDKCCKEDTSMWFKESMAFLEVCLNVFLSKVRKERVSINDIA